MPDSDERNGQAVTIIQETLRSVARFALLVVVCDVWLLINEGCRAELPVQPRPNAAFLVVGLANLVMAAYVLLFARYRLVNPCDRRWLDAAGMALALGVLGTFVWLGFRDVLLIPALVGDFGAGFSAWSTSKAVRRALTSTSQTSAIPDKKYLFMRSTGIFSLVLGAVALAGANVVLALGMPADSDPISLSLMCFGVAGEVFMVLPQLRVPKQSSVGK